MEQQTIGTEQRPLRIAIIGSGPAGFYAAGGLLKQKVVSVEVDMFDRLPTPFGLVRGGVAPDHQPVKAVCKTYERTALKPHFRFWGNVEFGKDVTKQELFQHYDCVVYAVGAQTDRQMGIPGEDLKGSHSATEFVGWYNGHPDFQHLKFDLSAKRVAIIGVGNVAVDVGRILAKTPEELAATDIADYAWQALKHNQVEEIYLIARRGPVQAAFTPVEARELLHLEKTDTVIAKSELELDVASQTVLDTTHDRCIVHNMEVMEHMPHEPGNKPCQLNLWFKRSPVEIYGKDGQVAGLKLVHNDLIEQDGRIRAKATERTEDLPVDLVFRSIGYLGVPLPDVSFDDWKGIIPNQEGRVIDQETKEWCEGEYVVGWAKRGPTGVIGTNKHDALDTIKHLLDDYNGRPSETSEKFRPEAIEDLLRSRKVRYVTYSDWQKLDSLETEAGQKKGKPREKFTTIEAMLEALGK